MSCLPELFQTQYFCQREDPRASISPNRSPARVLKTCSAARSNGVVLVASLFEKRAPGVYHNTAAIFDNDGSLRGLYRKMHIPEIRSITKSFISRPAISDSAPSTPAPESWARSSAGISGIQKAPG